MNYKRYSIAVDSLYDELEKMLKKIKLLITRRYISLGQVRLLPL